LGEILNDRTDLDLVTWDPVAYTERHIAAVDAYINSLEVIRGLKAQGLIKQGTVPGWRTPKDVGAFKVGTKLKGWTAHPKAAQVLEEMFGTTAFDSHGALKLLNSTRESLFRLKVFGGAFQAIDYSGRGLGLGLSELARGRPGGAIRAWASIPTAAGRAFVPGLDARMTRMAQQNPKLRALYKWDISAAAGRYQRRSSCSRC
jgi:hypothetical protein